MSDLINIPTKSSGDTLSAGEVNTIVNKTNDAITEQNQTKIDHAEALANKVDKVAGKGLSTEDYSTAEKNKLSGVAAGATNDTGATIKAKLEALEGDARLDASAIKGLLEGGGSSNVQLVEWPTGSARPTINNVVVVGDFFEGFSHVVETITIEETNYAVVTKIDSYNPAEFWKDDWPGVQAIFKLLDGTYLISCSTDGGDSYFFKKINSYGIEDVEFSQNAPVDILMATHLCQLSNGSIIIAGSDSQNTPVIRKISNTGVEDTVFTANVSGSFVGIGNSSINSIHVCSDDSIIFCNKNTKPRKINSDGILDETFSSNIANVDFDGYYDMILSNLSDNSVIYCYGHSESGRVKKTTEAGVEDADFTSNYANQQYGIKAILVDADDNIYLGGGSSGFGFLAMISSEGVRNHDFVNNDWGVIPVVYNLAFAEDGSSIIAFTSMGVVFSGDYRLNQGLIRLAIIAGNYSTVFLSDSEYLIIALPDRLLKYKFSLENYREYKLLSGINRTNNEISKLLENLDSTVLYPLASSTEGSIFIKYSGHLTWIQPPTSPSVLKHSGTPDSSPYWEAELLCS